MVLLWFIYEMCNAYFLRNSNNVQILLINCNKVSQTQIHVINCLKCCLCKQFICPGSSLVSPWSCFLSLVFCSIVYSCLARITINQSFQKRDSITVCECWQQREVLSCSCGLKSVIRAWNLSWMISFSYRSSPTGPEWRQY